jgi:hypothetical protein
MGDGSLLFSAFEDLLKGWIRMIGAELLGPLFVALI